MNKLQLSEFELKLPFEVQQTTLCFSLDDFERYGKTIDYDVYLPTLGVNLQREFCWTAAQKSELVKSMLKGIHIPPISCIIMNHKRHQIIDGKQRLSTMLDFYHGKFAMQHNGNDYFYNDLDDKAQHCIRRRSIVAYVAYEYNDALISDADKIAWFSNINFAGTPQDNEHFIKLKQLQHGNS